MIFTRVWSFSLYFCFLYPLIVSASWLDSMGSALKKGAEAVGSGIKTMGNNMAYCMQNSNNPIAQMDPTYVQKCGAMQGVGMGMGNGMMGTMMNPSMGAYSNLMNPQNPGAWMDNPGTQLSMSGILPGAVSPMGGTGMVMGMGNGMTGGRLGGGLMGAMIGDQMGGTWGGLAGGVAGALLGNKMNNAMSQGQNYYNQEQGYYNQGQNYYNQGVNSLNQYANNYANNTYGGNANPYNVGY